MWFRPGLWANPFVAWDYRRPMWILGYGTPVGIGSGYWFFDRSRQQSTTLWGSYGVGGGLAKTHVGPGVDLSHRPLIGRADEVDRISTLVADEAQAFLIAGAPGVGKSRLDEVSQGLAAAGCPTVRALAAASAASIAFGAFALLLGSDRVVVRGSARGNLICLT